MTSSGQRDGYFSYSFCFCFPPFLLNHMSVHRSLLDGGYFTERAKKLGGLTDYFTSKKEDFGIAARENWRERLEER